MNAAIAERRLLNHGLTRTGQRRPADVVAWYGAVQAQEYEAAKWGLAQRMPDGATDAQIERAFNQGRLLRTHVMRPTWHFVTPMDIWWLLELTAPRVHRIVSSYTRRLELDARTLTNGTALLERALGDHQYLTRTELGERLRRAGFAVAGIRLAFLTIYAELERVICSGPRRGKQFTYALLTDRAPRGRRLERDEAIAELSRRYFRSHGPATIRDFVWWSGLTTTDARRGLEMNKVPRTDADGRTYWSIDAARFSPVRERRVHLLPIYDEYLVAYRDRDAVPHGPSVITSPSRRRVTFQHALVIGGQIAGTWRIDRSPGAVSIEATVWRRLTARERQALAIAAENYGRFVGASCRLSVG